MKMQTVFGAAIGSFLSLAFVAAPSTTYAQVDERGSQKTSTSVEMEQAGKPLPSTKSGLTTQQKTILSELSSGIRAVATSTEQSVVHIEVSATSEPRGRTGARRAPGRTPPGDDDESQDEEQAPGGGQGQLPPDVQDQLRKFFGGQAPKLFEQEPADPMPRRGLGSGIIYDNKGHILTNNHVVGDATRIMVHTTDGRKLKAEVVGTDPLTDVAVIKVKEDGLKPVEFGDSSKMDVGDLVLALGNPFGLDYSVTMGIISAKGRNKLQLGSIYYQDFLQTDAAINPGNSGGALVNMDGQVIGMNTAIATQTGQYAGVGFAIPSNLAKRIADILIEKGKVVRGWLGVGIDNIKPDMARTFRFPADREGVLVEDVKAGSPAAEAGFQAGDIITKMDGQPVQSATQLQTGVTLTPPGTKVKFQVWRYNESSERGKFVDLTAELGELKESYLRGSARGEGDGQSESGSTRRYKSEPLGITYMNITDDLAKQFDWNRTPKGAIVVEVRPGGEASYLSIQPGDLIESINGKSIESAQELQEAFKKLEGQDFRMYLRGPRSGGRYVFVQQQ